MQLTKREQQIMDVLYRLGEGTANEIVDQLPDQPANATVRTLLRILEDKGAVKHKLDGKRFVYRPAVARQSAAATALRKLLDVFFQGSVEDALAAHLADPKNKLTEDDFDALQKIIEEHRPKQKASKR